MNKESLSHPTIFIPLIVQYKCHDINHIIFIYIIIADKLLPHKLVHDFTILIVVILFIIKNIKELFYVPT